MTLPAGKYRFYTFSILRGTGVGYSVWEPREDFSIPFTVTAGKAAYLGEIRMVPHLGRNIFGIPMPAGGNFNFVSNQQRDIALFREKFPGIDPATIVTRPIRSGDAPPELISFR